MSSYTSRIPKRQRKIVTQSRSLGRVVIPCEWSYRECPLPPVQYSWTKSWVHPSSLPHDLRNKWKVGVRHHDYVWKSDTVKGTLQKGEVEVRLHSRGRRVGNFINLNIVNGVNDFNKWLYKQEVIWPLRDSRLWRRPSDDTKFVHRPRALKHLPTDRVRGCVYVYLSLFFFRTFTLVFNKFRFGYSLPWPYSIKR